MKGKSLYVDLMVYKVPTRFLVDSGAEVSIIPDSHEVVSKVGGMRMPCLQPVLADGSKLTVLGVIPLEVEVNGQSVMAEFYVVNAHISPILGSDIMRLFDFVKLDFNDQMVTFGPRVTSTRMDTSSKYPRVNRVVISQDLVIPSHHEIVVDCLVESETPDDLEMLAGQSCVFEPNLRKEDESVGIARVLGVVRDGKFPIRICNPMSHGLKLKRNQRLGNLEVLEEPVVGVLSEEEDMTDVMKDDSSDAEQILSNLAAKADLSQGERRRLVRFLRKYREVFSLHGELGRYDGLPFSIDTGNARPIRQMPRRVPPHLKPEIDKQLDHMLEQNVIKPSTSAWASPICLVRKKDGSLRFCVDYRKLNSVSKGDAFPIPNMGDCLSSLAGSELFSTLDCISGYWQCTMDEDSAEKAAITTHRGLFQPTVLPFGVKGGVAHFSRVMSTLFGALQWKILLIYLDDLLVFSNTFEEHLNRLGVVFDCLLKAGLKLKPSKCSIAQKSLLFLGHVISKSGVAVNPDKVKAISEFPIPQNVEQLRRFLGMAGYYREYIEGYSCIVSPLVQLTKKGEPFAWSILCSQAFEKVKGLLVKAPILAYPDFDNEFVLTTDASNIGLGAVLSQKVKGKEVVISYASRTLSKAEGNYSTTERECLAVVWAVQHYSHYLLGGTFVIRTDHDPLSYLRSVPSPHGRLARWIGWLEQFSYKIVYTPGKSIPHADALSRAPVVSGMEIPSGISDREIQREQGLDGVVRYVVELWKAGKPPDRGDNAEVKQLWKVSDDFLYRNGILCVKSRLGRKNNLQVILPRSLVVRALQFAHDRAGHFAQERTLAAVRQRFFWGTMFNDVRDWCRSCGECQSRRGPMSTPRAPMQFSPIPSRPWQMISIDFMGPLVETEEPRCNKHVLVVTDRLSKYAIAVPLRDQTAETTASALFYEIFCTHSFPEFIHSDQGRNFESALIEKLCELCGIEKTRTTPYHPEGNGQTERHNRTLVEMLSKSINANTQKDWDEYLPVVQFAYNTSVHSSTGVKPFCLHFGREPRTLLDLIIPATESDKNVNSPQGCLKKIKSHIREQIRLAQEKMGDSMVRQKQEYDKRGNFRYYDKGELVMLREYKCPKGLKPKLWKDRWTGPWKILCRKSDVTYRVSRGEGKRKRKIVVHHNRLKPYIQRPHQLEDTNTGADKIGEKDETPFTESGFQRRDFHIEEEEELGEDNRQGEIPEPQPEPGGQEQLRSPPNRVALRNRDNLVPPLRYR